MSGPKRRKKDTEHDGNDESNDCLVDPENRKIFLFGPLTEEKAANFLMAFQTLDVDPGVITVVLNSPGGSIDAGYTIYDVIRLSNNFVAIHGYGKVYSMAVAVLQAGDDRLLSPECLVMVHDIFAELQGDISVSDAVELAADLVASNKRYQKLVAKRIKMKRADFAKMCRDETYLPSSKAVQLGFADGVMEKNK